MQIVILTFNESPSSPRLVSLNACKFVAPLKDAILAAAAAGFLVAGFFLPLPFVAIFSGRFVTFKVVP